MQQRNLTMIGFYCLVFGAVVVWAALRPAGERPEVPRILNSVAAVQPLERSEGIPEMRRVIQQMMAR